MDSRVDALSKVGPSLADLLMDVFCFAASPSFRGAAGLVSSARQAFKTARSGSSGMPGGGGDLGGQLTRSLANKVASVYQECRERGVDPSYLMIAETEVEILIAKAAGEDLVLLSAVREPEGFEAFLRGRAAERRVRIEEKAEPYFDSLIRALAAVYVEMAPWSRDFLVVALKSLLAQSSSIASVLKEQSADHQEMRQMLMQILDVQTDILRAIEQLNSGARSGRLLFGGRPDVAAGFVERVEQGRLRGLVIDGAQARTVLVGMAGCGKSQLASVLARECEAAGWGLVAWLNASSVAAVRSDLVELARRLGVDMSDKPTEDQAVRRCLDHLQSAETGDRLVVFDNVEDFDDLTGVVPRGVGLRVVATTRSGRGWRAQGWERVDVGVFPREESVAYLLDTAGSQDAEAADAVAGRLGDLPLALAQAAATASEQEWTLKRYLKRLEKYSSKQTIHPVPGDSYTRDVSSALRMAVDSALDRIDDGLREVARLQVGALAVLAESGVPTRWIDPLMKEDTGAAESNEDMGADAGGEDADARDDAAENAHLALTALAKASVVQQSADGGVTMLHRLQGQVLRENWNQGERAEAFDAAADLLDRVDIDSLPRKDTEGRRRETLDLIDQLRAIAAQDYSRPLFEHERTILRLLRVLEQAHSLELASAALDLTTPVKLALEHVETSSNIHFIVLNYYASLCILGREVDDAIEQLTLLRNICYERFGPTDEKTLGIELNLAMAHTSKDECPTTLSRLRKVHRICERELGDRASVTLHARLNLASTLLRMGHHHKSASLLKDRIRDYANVFGDCDTKTLAANQCLALAYLEIGNSQKAVNLIRANFEKYKDTLGETHPRTLSAISDLVRAYVSTDETSKAIQRGEPLVEQSRQFLGRDNSVTLYASNNLASAYQEAGRHHEAITLFKDTLEVCEEVLSPGHPLTITVRENLETLEREMNHSSASSPESSEG